jgi:hypothetical protein
MPKCPACNVVVDLSPVWKALGYRATFIGSGFGVACANCGAKLEISQIRAKTIGLSSSLLGVAALTFAAIKYGPLIRPPPGREYVTFLWAAGTVGVFFVLKRWLGRMLTVLKVAPIEKRLNFPLEWNTDIIDKISLSDSSTTYVGKPWMCRKCREVNPGEFDTCWKCGGEGARSGA